jgi:hypothetical protein
VTNTSIMPTPCWLFAFSFSGLLFTLFSHSGGKS